MFPIILTLRNKPEIKINSKLDLLEYLKYKNFYKINDSLLIHIDKNIEDYTKNDILTKSNFDKLVQQYQKCGTSRQALYWTRRGHTEQEAKYNISNNAKNASKKVDRDSAFRPNQAQYWINKGFNEQEAKEKVSLEQRKRSPRCIEHWINKGFSEQEAKLQVSKHQNNSEHIDYKKRLIPSQVHYWINKGFSEAESKEKVSDFQRNFSEEILIEKHGIKKAKEILEEVAQKKRDTFFLKSQEEQDAISIKRGSGSIGWWSEGKFKITREHDTPCSLYYFKCSIDGKSYWKIGITTKGGVKERFGSTFMSKYSVSDIEVVHDTLERCYMKEQEILNNFKEKRVKTQLGTEYFTENVLDSKLNILKGIK